jgi:hypothetical protein
VVEGEEGEEEELRVTRMRSTPVIRTLEGVETKEAGSKAILEVVMQ